MTDTPSQVGVTIPDATRKAPQRHPSTAIPRETVEEIAYRLYLARLEPPMTPEESIATTRTDAAGKVTASDATRRKHSASYMPMVRDALRVLWDMQMIVNGATECTP